MKNKSVILIGPAPHIIEQQINLSTFDVVCRVGDVFPLSNQMIWATSSRCDVWYPANSLLNRKPFICLDPNIKAIRTTKKGAKEIHPDAMHKWQHTTWALDSIMNELGCHPNRGLRAMIDILSQKPKSLYLTGFTFYQSENPYFDGYTTEEHFERTKITKGDLGAHLQDPQIKYFKKYILPHVSCDAQLLQSIGTLK